jgi:hypothetical protein
MRRKPAMSWRYEGQSRDAVDVAPARPRSGGAACGCIALALVGCPQLLADDFLPTRDMVPDAAVQDGGSAGAVGAVGAGKGRRDAGAADSGVAADASSGEPAASPNCNDGVRNQDETGVDCGGQACSPCNCVFGPFHDVLQVDGLGTDDRWGPMLSADGKSLYFSVQAASDEQIYRAVRSGTGAAFTAFAPLPGVNGSGLDGSPFVSRDDRTLMFFSDRGGGMGSRDLWTATRASASQEFGAAQPMAGVNSPAMDLLPRLSYDGLTLFFESTRPGGSGNSDLWAADRATPNGPFGVPHPRADLNTPSREEGFSLSGDQLTIVLSSSRGGNGMDLWLATRTDPHGNFGAPVLLSELNSSADDLDPGLSLDGREIFFTTQRDGDYRIYHALRDCQ